MTVAEIIDGVIGREGGYVNRATDRGGCTKYGVTRPVLAAHRGRPVTCADVEALERAEAAEILTGFFVRVPGFDRLTDDALRVLAVDFAVHSGAGVAVAKLQAAAGVRVDGLLGPDTRAAIDRLGAAVVYRRFLKLRAEYLSVLLRRADQWEYAAGWMGRLAAFM